jgi:hypothetical protein
VKHSLPDYMQLIEMLRALRRPLYSPKNLAFQ